MPTLVLDTNIVLDLWVFQDPAVQPLRVGLAQTGWRWLASAAMREEMARVLDYPHISRRLHAQQHTAQTVLERFDAAVTLVDAAPKASITCKDSDDQKFIDLAVAHQAWLFSKDKAVLCMNKRLHKLGSVLNPVLKTL
jgi:putative PIN family toxin of toxin-antitoxin system